MRQVIRKPQQARSIEKKTRIIRAGYELFEKVGFYGTNTAEIAKKAGVSTGVVYCYFKDKRDILLCVLEMYINNVFEPFLKTLDTLKTPVDFKKIVSEFLDEAIKAHKNNNKMHEVLHSMATVDEEINAKFIFLEDEITKKMALKLEHLGVALDNKTERIHLAMDMIQSFSHEYIFDKHAYIDYDKMKAIVLNSLVSLFV